MTWIFLALAASFFWGISNLFDKYAISKLSKSVPDFIFFGTIGSVLLLMILLVIRGGLEVIPANTALLALASGLLLNYSYIFYAKALERADASRVVPLFQTIPIFVLIIGYLFFDEKISALQLVGFLVIFLGGVLLAIDKFSLKKMKIDPAFWLMLVGSAITSIAILFSDHVLESTKFIPVFTYELIGFSIAGVSLLLYKPWQKEIIKGIRTATTKKALLFFGNDAVDIAGQVSSMYALVSAPSAALVTVMFGVQPFYVLVMGLILTKLFPNIIKENVSKKAIIEKTAGIIIIFLGVVLISVS